MDAAVGDLHAAGLDAVVAVVNVSADHQRSEAVASSRKYLADESTVWDWFDRGRRLENVVAVTEDQEYRLVALLVTRRYAGVVCAKQPTAVAWRLTENVLGATSGATQASLDAVRAEIEERCVDMLRFVNKDDLMADRDAFEDGSQWAWFRDAALLRYEPGQRTRVEG